MTGKERSGRVDKNYKVLIMNYKFSIIQKPRVFFEGLETGCRNPDVNKLENHNDRFDENIDKKP